MNSHQGRELAHRYVYLAMLAGIGGAALTRIVAMALALVGIELPGLMKYSGCPVPIICLFDDPTMKLIELLMPTHHFGPKPDAGPNVALQYLLLNGPLVASLLVVALAARRVLAFRAARAIDPPPSFSGFPFGLAILGFALVVYGYFGGTFYLLVKDAIQAGVIYVFVAFLWTELSSLRRAKAPPAADAAVETSLPRRRPMWTVISLVLPLIGVLGLFILLGTVGRGDGFAGLAAGMFGVVSIAIGLGLGCIATVIAVLRKERWTALQVLAFAVNFGIGLPMIVHLLRP